MTRRPDLYDTIGTTYGLTRRADDRLARRIRSAVGDAATVINVGAGTGSYEPDDCAVIAVEPSAVMLSQRRDGAAPAVRAAAEALPFPDHTFDVAMALWTIHHWTDLRRGLQELRRVAGRVVIVTAAAPVMNDLWLTSDYWPGMARQRRDDIQPNAVIDVLRTSARVEPLPLPHDCSDGIGEAFWARPEAYLDARVRAGMSCFQRIDPDEVERGLDRLAADLRSGAWNHRHGHLRELDELDCGHRLIVTE
jgi:SAM-dependent methyltransferase